MITYRYKALSSDGIETRGVVEAQDEFSAVQKIRETCPVITEIREVKEKKGIFSRDIGSSKINEKELSIMCSQFSIMLRSGMSAARCLELIARQTERKVIRKMMESAAEDVSEGSSLASGFERNFKGLPPTFVETIRAGEEAGTVEDSFERMEKYYRKSFQNKEKIRRVMIYPIFVVIIAVIVLMIVMVKVIPTLTATFRQLGGKLPAMTRFMIAASDFFSKYWILMMIVLVAAVLLLKFRQTTPSGRIRHAKNMLRMPVLGKINTFRGAAQFAGTMAVMLSSGITVNRAVEITSRVMDNAVLGEETAGMISRVEEGYPLGDCMMKTKFFPESLKEMCSIGEESGELDQTLETISEYFTNEADHATAKAISKLEPAILVILAVFAGFIVISIYLPMFRMYNLM